MCFCICKFVYPVAENVIARVALSSLYLPPAAVGLVARLTKRKNAPVVGALLNGSEIYTQ